MSKVSILQERIGKLESKIKERTLKIEEFNKEKTALLNEINKGFSSKEISIVEYAEISLQIDNLEFEKETTKINEAKKYDLESILNSIKSFGGNKSEHMGFDGTVSKDKSQGKDIVDERFNVDHSISRDI